MKVVDVDLKDRSEDLVEKLLVVWESSVRATHLFLSDNEISEIKKYVPQALKEIPRLILLKNDRNTLVGFMGIVDSHLEMLFIAPEERGKGFGKKLLEYGITKYSINDLAVNEQNPRAKGFYEYMGFEVYKRTEFDEQGNPYPLLYMKRG
ncbi:GNAT family N-acetyltransferase [Lactococcus formosensis]|uniref:GNAT family N-acetyltransferase n=1 Tax=Lactococcus formosensis TaxID=1281486 RepID=A0A9X4NX12_9LACT|nr:GNAT family N-acetyltransferase [Lactococcus formosensis]NHI99945.1 GNAT family N-acetyltransferase [Lactococcus garvieae]MCO7180965.1 GNAT family N-acetyltransferase [Lactococcus formosensis]MDG6111998.1 GNAT family N-acetyltransferase [Lactococcus formosensis]MDG6118099.1 GNAT family N-acetyltransferase [Lactococcus formosensis]MDG6126851.1 GNAT family N-acetyltransferase [Lactococcus formosensis]